MCKALLRFLFALQNKTILYFRAHNFQVHHEHQWRSMVFFRPAINYSWPIHAYDNISNDILDKCCWPESIFIQDHGASIPQHNSFFFIISTTITSIRLLLVLQGKVLIKSLTKAACIQGPGPERIPETTPVSSTCIRPDNLHLYSILSLCIVGFLNF